MTNDMIALYFARTSFATDKYKDVQEKRLSDK
jgi:hypothetical protein